jgi:hypothetical protein
MVSFKNSFFSLSGQVERFTNVGAVLSQSLNPFSKNKPSVDTNIIKNPVIAAAANALVQHPFVTALAVAAPLSSTGRSVIASGVKALPTSVKILGGIAAIPVASAVIKSPKSQVAIINTISKTPESLVNLGSDVGTFVENPSLKNATNIITENKYAAGFLAAAALTSGGLASFGLASNALNTQAIRQNTESVKQSGIQEIKIADIKPVEVKLIQPEVPKVVTPTQTLTPTPVKKKKKKKVTKKKKKKVIKKKKIYKKKKTTKKHKKRY